ncbi:EF-P 5-aminopentanol modification-associated protein YfmH [Salinicoccus halitifaciens]|uniref:Zn-dependent peptidase n=1 Tax=Salinicoccus halitifaciens TaxID=1073415 RepID=A0ABV2E754_9STAP|nr:pitrilysin family protein [Salinicoccus halitifaciens]MCD2136683.1 insulinase family protein [Salinicoccus halitifaciens]
MKHIEYKEIDECVYHDTMDNGLEVYLIQKAGYNKKFVTYTTKYGSMDNRFEVDGEEYSVPDGIAHFLEHKMFEKEDGDVFDSFAKGGANANAFTSYDRTSYLFSTTDDFYKNLTLLMDMVEKPYFTEETVEREIGIINEEIKMYQDNPGYRLYFDTISQMYSALPVKIDIAGTEASISEITKDHLYLCHDVFYHPSNMVMIMAGDFDVEETFAFIREHQEKRGEIKPLEVNRLLPEEERDVAKSRHDLYMDVEETKVMLGFKNEKIESASERLTRDIAMMFGLDMIFGEQSEYYYQLLEDGIIDDSFNFAHNEEKDFAHVLMTTQTDDPERFTASILGIIEDIKDQDFFTEEKLTNQKREVLGDYLSSLNSPEYIANQYTKYLLDGYDLYKLPDLIEEITVEDIKKYIFVSLDRDYLVECVLRPESQKEAVHG